MPLLVPADQRVLSWYTCGPTVYDDAHLGHARSYVHVDVVQRVLSDVFGLRLHCVLGMTDIDDKIVAVRAGVFCGVCFLPRTWST